MSATTAVTTSNPNPSEKLIASTYFRRHMGEVFEKLDKTGPLFITKGSSIVAELHPPANSRDTKTTAEKLLSLAGAWKGSDLDNDALWDEALTKDSKPIARF